MLHGCAPRKLEWSCCSLPAHLSAPPARWPAPAGCFPGRRVGGRFRVIIISDSGPAVAAAAALLAGDLLRADVVGELVAAGTIRCRVKNRGEVLTALLIDGVKVIVRVEQYLLLEILQVRLLEVDVLLRILLVIEFLVEIVLRGLVPVLLLGALKQLTDIFVVLLLLLAVARVDDALDRARLVLLGLNLENLTEFLCVELQIVLARVVDGRAGDRVLTQDISLRVWRVEQSLVFLRQLLVGSAVKLENRVALRIEVVAHLNQPVHVLLGRPP